ncbi:hypothetical protein [Fulvivirga sp.]|uniref:hypothetical protein n=1 Tax=Fulvivirga sp. TaxID=1931237 RepID=UPI0032ED373E
MRYLTALVFFFFASNLALACSCDWSGNFLEISKNSDVITKVKVIGYENYFSREFETDSIPLTVVVEVIQLYKGKLTDTTIRLAGDDGMLCRSYATELKPDKYYLLHYDYKGMTGVPEISSCGEYFLKIEDDKVVSEAMRLLDISFTKTMSLRTFESKLMNTLGKCANTSLDPADNLVNTQVQESCLPNKSSNFPYYWLVLLLLVALIFLYIIRSYRIKKA